MVGADARPVAGAAIFLTRARRNALRTGGAPVGASGDDGTFVIDGVEPGVVHLAPAAEGAVSAWFGPIPVRTGERTTGVLLELRPGEALSGRVFERESGAGLIARVSFASTYGARTIDTTSASDGRFTIDGLTAGDQVIFSVECEGYAYAVGDEVYGGPNSFVLTALRLAEPLEIPMRATPPAPSTLTILDAETGARIEGARIGLVPDGARSVAALPPIRGEAVLDVTDETGRAFRDGGWPWRFYVTADGYQPAVYAGEIATSGVLDVALDRSTRITVDVAAVGALVEVREWGRTKNVLARGRTDPSGIVEFDGLPAGRARIVAHDAENARGVEAMIVLPVRDPVVLELESYATIFGRVSPHRLADGVKQRVLALEPEREPRATVVADDGTYSLDLPSGTYSVGVENAPHETYRLIAYTWPARKDATITLAAGERRELDLTGFDAPGSMSGRLVVAGGRPVAFQPIRIEWRGNPADRIPPDAIDTATDHGGGFRVPSLAAGPWSVRWVTGEKELIAATEVEVLADVHTEVELAPSTGTIRIRGAPLTLVSLSGTGESGVPGNESQFVVPADGAFEVVRTPGDYWVRTAGEQQGEYVRLAAGAIVEVLLDQ